jgi:CRP/FNR family cyclic AMP-dependent transcriptional regulator
MTEASRQTEVQFKAGTTVFRQGDAGDEMFVISRGRIRLLLGAEDHEREIAVLQPGDFFGELSLLRGARRTATAVAADDCVLLAIRRDVFAMMMQDDLEVVFRMMDALGGRLSQTDNQVHQLARTLAQVRSAADLLKRCLPANGYRPLNLDAQELARAWGVSEEAAKATLSDLASQGVGTMHDARWTLVGAEQAQRLHDLLVRTTQ